MLASSWLFDQSKGVEDTPLAIKTHKCQCFGSLTDTYNDMSLCIAYIWTICICKYTHLLILFSYPSLLDSCHAAVAVVAFSALAYDTMMFSTCCTFVSSPTKRRNYLPALCADATHHSERSRLPSRDRWSLVFDLFCLSRFSSSSFPSFWMMWTVWVSSTVQMKVWPLNGTRHSRQHRLTITVSSRDFRPKTPWSAQIQQDLNLIKFQFLGCF